MKDVAQRAGVSTATVSNVLGRRKPVDDALARKVHAAAAELQYEVDRAASLLRSGRTQVIGVLVPSLENPFFMALVGALERVVRAEGYDIIIASSNDEEALERQRMAALLSWRPAGIIVIPSTDSFLSRPILEQVRVPYVVVDRMAEGHEGEAVLVDNRAAAVLAARHMLELGHREILVVASSLELANIRERCAGIGEAYAQAGLPAPSVLEVGMSFEVVGSRIEQWLAAKGRPSGVIALTNFATQGVIAAFKGLGVRVPQDVSLIGFDDYAWMAVSTPSITAVAQPVAAMAASAWELLHARFGGETTLAARRLLGCHLEVRQSTASVGPSLLGARALELTGSRRGPSKKGRTE